MTISALEALRVTELLDHNDQVVDLSQFEPIDLQKKLDYYRDTRIRSVSKDAQESMSDTDDLAAVVSSGSARNETEALLPSCCFYNRLYANDPLIKHAGTKDDTTDAYNQAFGMGGTTGVDVDSVARSLKYFQELAPLIRIGALSILPVEELVSPTRAPDEGLPIFYSEDWFRSEVPEHIHDFVHNQAIIGEVAPVPDGGGLFLFEHAPKSPCRGISVQFSNDGPKSCPPFYLLSEMRMVDKIGDTHIKIEQQLDWDKPPSQTSFDAWVYQSINRTIITRLRNVAREIGISSGLNATYLTESQFESELCGMSFDTPTNPDGRTTGVNFLTANAPYLRINNPKTLAKLRTDNPRLFERWQHSLLAAIQELNGYDGDFDARAKQIFETEIQPQIDELNEALIKLSGGIGGATLLTAGTIGMALISNATLPFAAVLGLGALAAAGRAMPSVAEYLTARKGPAFVWNRLTK